MGMTDSELAYFLHRDALTFSRWECEKVKMDEAAEAAIRLLAIRQLRLPEDADVGEIAGWCKPSAETPPIVIDGSDPSNYQSKLVLNLASPPGAFDTCRSDALGAKIGDCRRGGAHERDRTACYGPALSMMRRIRHIPKIRPTMPMVCSIIVARDSGQRATFNCRPGDTNAGMRPGSERTVLRKE
jgi:hypothetical protein